MLPLSVLCFLLMAAGIESLKAHHQISKNKHAPRQCPPKLNELVSTYLEPYKGGITKDMMDVSLFSETSFAIVQVIDGKIFVDASAMQRKPELWVAARLVFLIERLEQFLKTTSPADSDSERPKDFEFIAVATLPITTIT